MYRGLLNFTPGRLSKSPNRHNNYSSYNNDYPDDKGTFQTIYQQSSSVLDRDKKYDSLVLMKEYKKSNPFIKRCEDYELILTNKV